MYTALILSVFQVLAVLKLATLCIGLNDIKLFFFLIWSDFLFFLFFNETCWTV